jgi:hypothetical protein
MSKAFVAGTGLEEALKGGRTALNEHDRAVRSYLLALSGDPAITAKVGPYTDAPRPLDLWGGLDLPLQLSFLYAVTVPLDLQITIDAPLVLTRATRFTRTPPQAEAAGAGITLPAQAQRADEAQWFAPLGSVAVDVEHDGRFAASVDDRDGAAESRPLPQRRVVAERQTAHRNKVAICLKVRVSWSNCMSLCPTQRRSSHACLPSEPMLSLFHNLKQLRLQRLSRRRLSGK